MHTMRGEAPLTSVDVVRRMLPTGSLRRGDDIDEVDQHLEVLAHALRTWEAGDDGASVASSSQAAGIAFTTRRLRTSYSSVAVDDLLLEIRAVLAGYEAGTLAPPASRAALERGDDGARAAATSTTEGPVTAEEVASVTFEQSRLRDGYECDEVDEFLDVCIRALRGDGSIAASAVRARRFTATWFGDGYAVDEVDAMLERIARTLEVRSGASG